MLPCLTCEDFRRQGTGMNLLGIIRLSDFRETSASPQQQREMMTDYYYNGGL
jgi:hypothetical protein